MEPLALRKSACNDSQNPSSCGMGYVLRVRVANRINLWERCCSSLILSGGFTAASESNGVTPLTRAYKLKFRFLLGVVSSGICGFGL